MVSEVKNMGYRPYTWELSPWRKAGSSGELPSMAHAPSEYDGPVLALVDFVSLKIFLITSAEGYQ